MRITQRQLRQIIKEELHRTLCETPEPGAGGRPFTAADLRGEEWPDDWQEQGRDIMSIVNVIYHATDGIGTDKSELIRTISHIDTAHKYKHVDAEFQKKGGLLALINDEMDWLDAFAKVEIMETLNKNLKSAGLHFGIAGDPVTGELVRY